ncbi:F-box family protein [Corchorus olitorius]|uniref:F-box family protein n=1 Tax=Corchorus olitorius TaxID=93759 RepID=A0A1R3H806_9ROSI|nr:F-box family protein [Corchorus olitorius]
MERILSFLPAKDAARTSVLSKEWPHVWKSLPNFSFRFDAEPFLNKNPRCCCTDADQVDKYMDLIDKSLKQIEDRKVLIQRFQLDLLRCGEVHREVHDASRLNQFIELANQNFIKVLILRGRFPWHRNCDYISLPPVTFASNSYSVLKLKECKFGPEIFSEANNLKKFPCLRVLSLNFVPLNEETVDSLLANCPLLETLTLQLQRCYYGHYYQLKQINLPKLKLRNLPNLKKARIEGVDKIEIESLHIQLEDSAAEELEEILDAPPIRVKHLIIRFMKFVYDSVFNSYEALLDCCFWVLRPEKITVKGVEGQGRSSIDDFIELLRDRLITTEENPECCSDSRIKCWWHYLDEVEIRKSVDRRNSITSNVDSSPPTEGYRKVVFKLKWK